ncbi:amino acid adenylation domain-containing protein [Streptomyces sp. T-3]|nr:amino acid adenylation domain-containing protein [Streptomyces sp. T-3]
MSSLSEERLHFVEQLSEHRAPYKVIGSLELTGVLDRNALREALTETIAANEALRTGFLPSPSGLARQVHAEALLDLREVDVRTSPADERLETAGEKLKAIADEPFDLERPPLLRACLARIEEDRWHLVLVCHHIVSDGQSMVMLVREVAERYRVLTGATPGRAAVPETTSPAQFAAGDRSYADTSKGAADAAYWAEQLAVAPTECNLPYDHPEVPVRTFRGSTLHFRISAQELAPVLHLANGQRFVALLAVWGVLLTRYCGQEGVIVGAPFARRTSDADQQAQGFFANTLPLHLDLRGTPDFHEVLTRIRTTVVGGLEHQQLDFGHIIESLPAAGQGHSQRDDWMKAMFVARDPFGTVDFGPALVVRPVPFSVSGARVDLQLTMAPDEQGIAFELEYSLDAFTEETARRLAGHYRQLCLALAADPDRSVHTVALLTPAEEQQLHGEWNSTARPYPDETVLARIERQVRETPDAVAVRFRGQEVSYAELDALSNRLAHALRRQGVGAQDLVGVFMQRSVEMVVALLGIQKAQGAYVPMDPDYPADRIAYMVEDAAMKVVLTQDAIAERLDVPDALVLDVATAVADAAVPDTATGLDITPDSLAYMIYTSGSTGRPKGVLLEHRALYNRLEWMQQTFPIDPSDRIVQKTPFSFDVSVWEFFWPLMFGASILMAEPGVHRDPLALAETIRSEQATVAHFVPSMLDIFLQSEVGALPDLRLVFSSGEALSAAAVGGFYEQFQGRLHNLYGPTEAAIDVSHWHCTPEDVRGAVPIGRPVANTQLYVLDGAGNPQPAGLSGELHIGGVQLARGYHGRDDLTAEKFIPDSFSTRPGARLYRTGDLARFRADGAIEYLGRLDDQIKLRGLRIELGEIEACLRDAAECTEAAVSPVKAPSGATVLVGYYRRDDELDAGPLRQRLGEQLPEFMVPVEFVRVDRMPLTPNGKLNRKALPVPDLDGETTSADTASGELPSGPAEELVAKCWRDILHVDTLYRDSSFFSVGGDSLLGIRLVAALRAAGYEITVGDLFLHHRLADLAAAARPLADAAPAAPAHSAPEPVAENRVEDSWAASSLQLGMIYHSGLTPDVPVYHDIFCYGVSVPRIDERALVRAWELLAERHPVLRGRFDLKHWAEPRMVIESRPPLPVTVVDCSADADPEAAVREWVTAEKQTPVDTASAPAYRVRYFVTAPDRVVLGFSFHHAILDGWSIASVVEEAVTNYGALLSGSQPPNESAIASDIAQRQYAELERQAAADEEQAAFWSQVLDGAEALEIPRLASGAREAAGPGEVVVEGRMLAPDLLDTLRARAREWGVPLKSVFLAAHMRVMSLIAGRDDVVSGLVANGRPEVAGAEAALGMFLNTLPFRLSLDPRESWRSLAERCFAVEQQLQPRRWFPLAEIQRRTGMGSFSDVIFNFTNFHVHQHEDSGNEPFIDSVEYFEQTNVPFVVYIGSNAFAGGWECRIGYDPTRYTAEQIARYLGYYTRGLTALAAGGDVLWAQTQLLSAGETALVLPSAGREPSFDLEGSVSIRDRFEAIAAKYAEHTAVSCDGRALTYRELDEQANAIAHHLRQQGVTTGSFVGLALERDLEMVVCILATLKAGAAYVPIDPGYPQDRIRAIVEDADVRVLIAPQELLDLFPERTGVVGDTANLDAVAAGGADDGPAITLTPDSAAYVIFTSGSTGRPKGVLVPHGNVLRLFDATGDWFGFNETDRWALFHSFAFDFSVWEMWGALLHGGHLVVVPYWASRSVKDFAELLVREQITVLNQTPSAFGQVKRALMERTGSQDTALRYVVFGGEALDFASLTDWFAHFEDTAPQLVNMYGITETTVHVTYRPVTSGDVSTGSSLIGEPIPDLGLYLLDERQQPVPVGTTGELVVSGAGVAHGYLGRPEETARRFVEVDLGTGSGTQRMYRSGDLGRRLPSGDIEYLGRGDAQVKIQGYRIETGDIEAAMVAHSRAASSLVVAITRPDGSKALVGYWVPETLGAEKALDAGGMRAHLQEVLPGYMVPNFLIPVERWPLTVNGKIDRKALPAPEDHLAGAHAYAAPRTSAEALMATVWQEVLGLDQVGIDDDYYALGGDSIQGIRLVGALSRHGIAVTLQELFRHQTIRELFAHNETLGSATDGLRGQEAQLAALEAFELLDAADRALLPVSVVDAYPATQLQLGMIFHSEVDPHQAAFHDLISYQVNRPFDRMILQGLLEQTVAQHEVLRTSFALSGFTRPLQLVHEQAPVNLTVHDIAHVPESAQEALLDEWFEQEKQTSFLWDAAPLMRFIVHRRTADCFNLSISFHHAILDGWSFSHLMAGLLDDYRRAVAGEATLSTAPSVLAYRDYIRLEAQAQQEPAARSFWMEHLDGAPYLKLPRAADANGRRWAETRLEFSEEFSARLREAASRHRVPVKHLCLAAHIRALSLVTGERDVTTGVFANGRPEHPDADRMKGLFLNILPVRVQAHGATDALVAAVSEAEHSHLPYRRFSYASIQEAMGGGRLVETSFNYVNFNAYQDRLGDAGEELISDIRWFEHSDFALLATFGIDLFTDRLHLTFNTAAHVLGQEALESVAAVYEQVLLNLVGGSEGHSAARNLEKLVASLPAPVGAEAGSDLYDRRPAGAGIVSGPAPRRDEVIAVLREIYQECADKAPADPLELLEFQPDSLTALRTVSALRRRCGLVVPVGLLLGPDPVRALLRAVAREI